MVTQETAAAKIACPRDLMAMVACETRSTSLRDASPPCTAPEPRRRLAIYSEMTTSAAAFTMSPKRPSTP
jgi:hypothetical protein